MPTPAADQEVSIVFNLREELPGFFVPLAYIVSVDKGGQLAHIQQQATPETVGAFQLPLTPEHQSCFLLVEDLQPQAIANHFKGKSRKLPDINQLLDKHNKEQAPTVWRYIHRKLDELISRCVAHQFPITLNIERQLLAKDFLLGIGGQGLQPLLAFKKTASRVHYTLQLLTEQGDRLTISRHHVIPLTNYPTPAWLLIDRELHQLEHLNGYLVKPFLEKDEVLIPADRASSYFRQFIAKVVSKVNIEAEGFAVDTKSNLLACHLELSLHPLENRYYLLPKMDYGAVAFGWNEKTNGKTLLDLSGEEVKITRIERNDKQEASFLRRLAQEQCLPIEQSQFFLPKKLQDSPPDPLAIFQWLIDHRHQLVRAGFHLPPPYLEDKNLSFLSGKLSLDIKNERDWFDLRGDVLIGDYRIPFPRIAAYIKRNERLYPLPNGEYFLIPKEWMARYAEVLQFAKAEKNSLQLAKSHYTLLEKIDPELAKNPEAAQEAALFTPSPKLKAQLRPYQLAGAQWLIQHFHQALGACLADDMGLGKTLQTIAVLLYAKEQKALLKENNTAPATFAPQLDLFAQPSIGQDEAFLQPLNALIVLPASLVYNWESEIKKFAPTLSVLKHSGQNRNRDSRILRRYDIILTTYQTASRDQALLATIPFEYIILDESQQIKNRQSKVFKAINELNAQHKISLSGTPIENALSDLWAQMQFLNPGLLGSYAFFKKTFQIPIEKTDDELKKEQLRKLVGPYLLRRTKREVAKDLPPIHTQQLLCEMAPEQRRRYEEEKSAARNLLLDSFLPNDFKYRGLVVKTLMRLRQLANHPVLVAADYTQGSGKFEEIMEQWEVVRKGGHKALFFSSFVTHLELFKTAFEAQGHPYAWLSGETAAKKRQQEVQRFQEDPSLQAFFISIKSGGTGLNLQAADYVFILDPWWNPKIEEQAIGRAHRIGRTEPVFVQQYISKDTIEEKIVLLQQRKSQLAEDIISQNSQSLQLDKEELSLLLN